MNRSSNGVSRRGFLRGMAGILAAGVAPAVLPSGVIMPIRKLWIPDDDCITVEEWIRARQAQIDDKQRLYNYWLSTVTEQMALAPKAPWLF